MAKRLALLVAAGGAALLAGCGGINGLGLYQSVPSVSNMRVLDGSPDAGSITVSATSAVSNTAVSLTPSGAITYGKLGSDTYQSVTSGVQQITVTANSSTTPTLTCTTPQLAVTQNYTVVIAGHLSGTPDHLQCQIFYDQTANTTTSTDQIVFHNAAPNSGTIQFGTQNTTSGAYNSPIGSASPAPLTYTNAGYTDNTSSPSGEPTQNSSFAGGVSFYAATGVASGATPTAGQIFATTAPSQGIAGASGVVGSQDPNNILPFPPSYNFSIYLIDGTATTAYTSDVLIGIFD